MSRLNIITNIILIFACIVLGLVLSMRTIKIRDMMNQTKVDYNSYKSSAEERIDIMANRIEVLTEEYNKLSDATMEEMLSYIEPLKKLDKKEYMTQYQRIIEKYGNLEQKGLGIYEEYTAEEIEIMCRCIETEVYQCPFDAKVNVANVIFNRIESEKFPNDPHSVITAKNQFAYHRNNISEDTLLALEYAYLTEDTTNNAIAFRSDCSPENWGGWNLCHYDGYHWFYN